jgi:hypothetical protein
MADLAESVMADATATGADLDHDGALGNEGGNNFQRAISAWRSTSAIRSLVVATDLEHRHRPHIYDSDPGQHRVGNCTVSTGFDRTAEGFGTKDQGL